VEEASVAGAQVAKHVVHRILDLRTCLSARDLLLVLLPKRVGVRLVAREFAIITDST
jgi:hypothetical protein